jgi:hypothetical protein
MLLKASLNRSRPAAASLMSADADATPTHPVRGAAGQSANAGARIATSVMLATSMAKRRAFHAPRCRGDLIGL